jgi:hypothetical protein
MSWPWRQSDQREHGWVNGTFGPLQRIGWSTPVFADSEEAKALRREQIETERKEGLRKRIMDWGKR